MSQNDLSDLIIDVREQIIYLQELGVEAFDIKLQAQIFERRKWKLEIGEPIGGAAKVIQDSNSEVSDLRSEISKPQTARQAGSRLAELPSLSKRPVSRIANGSGSTVTETKAEVRSIEIIPALPEPVETIEQIRAEIGAACERCKLCSLGRSRVVNSVGKFNADLMFVGEAPGADEDEQGEPFVGRAGQLLTKIIEGIGLKREDVFIGNINRCRPPDNRTPEPDESVVCKPFLIREIAVVRPKVIVVLGAHAAQNLLETNVPIGKLRGHFHDYLGVKVMPTFHPAYLLRDPRKKREVWEDMKMVRDYLKDELRITN